MRAASLFSIALVLGVGAGPCARCSARDDRHAATDASASASSATVATADGGTPARCAAIGPGARWGGEVATDADTPEGAPVPFAAEIGGAAADDGAFYVGARASGPGGVTALLRLDATSGTTTTLATWPSMLGARAPLVAVARGRVVVGRLVDADGARSVRVEQLVGGAPAPLGLVPQGLDESEATSLLAVEGGALVAWDDADPTHSFGRVRLVRLDASTAGTAASADANGTNGTNDANGTNGPGSKKPAAAASGAMEPPPRDVISPSTTDAAWPLLVAAPDGKRAALLWLAERPERAPFDAGEEGAGEPSQAEAMRWVEAVVIDVSGARAVGPPRSLTPHDGHAQTFGASWTAQGLMVAVRDDARPTDADGGTLLAVRAPIDEGGSVGDPQTLVVAVDDLAPGAPFVAAVGADPFASILGLRGEARFVSMLGQGAFSRESALDDRRAIASGGGLVLAVRAAGPAVELTLARCQR